MSTPKGWAGSGKEDRVPQQFSTVSPSGKYKNALDVKDKSTVYQVGTDAAEANSTSSVIVATAHAAKKGDLIRFTSGVHSGTEVEVLSVLTNSITLAHDLDAAVGTGNTFAILRPVSMTVASDGTISVSASPAPIQYMRDGVATTVTEDNVTAANNRPLPVRIEGADGQVTITAGNLNVSLDSATDSVSAVVTSSVLPTGAATSANQATEIASLSSIDTKLTSPLTVTGPLTDAQLRASPVPVSGSITATNSANGATGAAVPAQATQVGGSDGTNLIAVKVSATGVVSVDGSAVTQPVSAAALPLPTGASTSALQTTGNSSLSSIDGKIVAVNTGAVTISAALPAGTNNIGDVDVLSLPAIPAGTNLIGSVDVNLDVVDFIDTTPVLDTSVSNITASAGSPLEIVASLAANVKKLRVNDTTGEFVGIYTGAAASEVLQAVAGPGIDGDIEVKMSSGERVSLRNMANSAISVGKILIQFYG
ncbi:MAG: hypothetical protein IT281_09805 [Ignavibacteria bacterium]|nr:hypothetical protein [Ignavibacteria bacterium]